MFYFNFKDKECSLKIKLIQDLFVILYTALSFKNALKFQCLWLIGI